MLWRPVQHVKSNTMEEEFIKLKDFLCFSFGQLPFLWMNSHAKLLIVVQFWRCPLSLPTTQHLFTCDWFAVLTFTCSLTSVFLSSPVSHLKRREARGRYVSETSFPPSLPLARAAWPPLLYHHQPWILTIGIIVFTSTMITAFCWAHLLPSCTTSSGRTPNGLHLNSKQVGWPKPTSYGLH